MATALVSVGTALFFFSPWFFAQIHADAEGLLPQQVFTHLSCVSLTPALILLKFLFSLRYALCGSLWTWYGLRLLTYERQFLSLNVRCFCSNQFRLRAQLYPGPALYDYLSVAEARSRVNHRNAFQVDTYYACDPTTPSFTYGFLIDAVTRLLSPGYSGQEDGA